MLPYSPSRQSTCRLPGGTSHFRTAPSFHFRYAYGTERNGKTTRGPRVGLSYRSQMSRTWSAVRNPDSGRNVAFGFTGISSGESFQARGCTRRRRESAPVGQLVMHSPHCTQLDSPMTASRSKLIRVS